MKQDRQKRDSDQGTDGKERHWSHGFQHDFGEKKGCGTGNDDCCQQDFPGLPV